MKKKKSYLNTSNIGNKSAIKEFNILFPKLAEKIKNYFEKKQYKAAIKVAKKSPEMKKHIDSINKSSKAAENAFEKQFGMKISLSKHKLEDFF